MIPRATVNAGANVLAVQVHRMDWRPNLPPPYQVITELSVSLTFSVGSLTYLFLLLFFSSHVVYGMCVMIYNLIYLLDTLSRVVLPTSECRFLDGFMQPSGQVRSFPPLPPSSFLFLSSFPISITSFISF